MTKISRACTDSCDSSQQCFVDYILQARKPDGAGYIDGADSSISECYVKPYIVNVVLPARSLRAIVGYLHRQGFLLINDHIEQINCATSALLERSDTIIVCTVSSIYGLGDPTSYLKMVLHVDRGDKLDQRELLRR